MQLIVIGHRPKLISITPLNACNSYLFNFIKFFKSYYQRYVLQNALILSLCVSVDAATFNLRNQLPTVQEILFVWKDDFYNHGNSLGFII